jgi:1-acyl-sn-glycerol-3-phosphate acyltransferase
LHGSRTEWDWLINFLGNFEPASLFKITGKMESASEIGENQKIDVKKVLYSKNPALARAIPGFVINYLKRIVHQDELNEFLKKWGHLRDSELIAAGLDHFEIKFKVSGSENIPKSGRFIFVSNHPLGGLDGLVFIYELSKHFRDLKFPVNDILTNIKNLSGIFLPVNKLGGQAKDAAKLIEEAYSSDCQVLYFPAGLCSRKKNGIIKDLQWHKSFITKSIQHKRDIVPAFFSGRNSNFFYNLASIRKFLGLKTNIEMLYLADEMFKQKDKEIKLVFGVPVPWETFNKTRSALEWADWMKSKSYDLESFVSG